MKKTNVETYTTASIEYFSIRFPGYLCGETFFFRLHRFVIYIFRSGFMENGSLSWERERERNHGQNRIDLFFSSSSSSDDWFRILLLMWIYTAYVECILIVGSLKCSFEHSRSHSLTQSFVLKLVLIFILRFVIVTMYFFSLHFSDFGYLLILIVCVAHFDLVDLFRQIFLQSVDTYTHKSIRDDHHQTEQWNRLVDWYLCTWNSFVCARIQHAGRKKRENNETEWDNERRRRDQQPMGIKKNGIKSDEE